jgi:transcription elongation factor GreA
VANNKVNPVTYEGLKKLEERLEYMKSVVRIEIADRIKKAREFGDISENAEYDAAKNEQASIENEINVLEEKLKNVKIIDEEDLTTEIIGLGSRIKIREVAAEAKKKGKAAKVSAEHFEYHLVGSLESNPDENMISNESPLGTALMNRKVGDIIDVLAPIGTIKYEILEISK